MIKIAIIEDDPTISQMYRMKFESDGFDVRLAANGQIGIEVVEKFQPDIILLDLQMPEMDGAEALKRIRSKDWGKTIPVIVLTNLGEEEAPHDLKKLASISLTAPSKPLNGPSIIETTSPSEKSI